MLGKGNLRKEVMAKGFICESIECQKVIEQWMNTLGGRLDDFELVLNELQIETPVKIILTSTQSDSSYLICMNLNDITKVTEIEIHSERKLTIILPELKRTYLVNSERKTSYNISLVFQE